MLILHAQELYGGGGGGICVDAGAEKEIRSHRHCPEKEGSEKAHAVIKAGGTPTTKGERQKGKRGVDLQPTSGRRAY